MELSKEEEEGESSSFETRQLGGCSSLKGGDSVCLWAVVLPISSEIN